MTRLRRAPIVRSYDVRDHMVILATSGAVQELRGSTAELARELVRHCARPRSRAELYTHVETLTGGPLQDTRVVDELLELLEHDGVLVSVPDEPPPRERARPQGRLLLGLCGAVAASLAPSLIAALQQRGFELRVAATESALRFVSTTAIAALIHEGVHHSMWPEQQTLPVPHINLAQWADVVLIWPATATTIARLANGDYSNLVSAIALTCKVPVVVVPSMNADMFAAAAVQRNIQRLIEDGMHVLAPGSGAELADAPGERASGLGPTPPHAVVIEMLELALRIARSRRTHVRAGPPRDAEEWDRYFRLHGDRELGWHSDEPDDDLRAVLERELGPGKRLLDVGTGLGTLAIAGARLGAHVLATDVSGHALSRAAARAGRLPIAWVRDDITRSDLLGDFDVIVDRGCLHLLAPEQWPSYAATLTRVCTPGGLLVIKTHALSEGAARQTWPFDAQGIQRVLGEAFVLESDSESRMPGPEAAPEARLFLLRRQA